MLCVRCAGVTTVEQPYVNIMGSQGLYELVRE